MVKDKEFNDYAIKAVGKKVTIKVNGETMVDQEFREAAGPDEASSRSSSTPAGR